MTNCLELFKLDGATSVLRLMKGLGISGVEPSGSISKSFVKECNIGTVCHTTHFYSFLISNIQQVSALNAHHQVSIIIKNFEKMLCKHKIQVRTRSHSFTQKGKFF
jgi:hypothetical protein